LNYTIHPLMKKLLTLTFFLGVIQFVCAQNPTIYYKLPKKPLPSFFGQDAAGVKKMLYDYLYHYHYNSEWVLTDSSIELKITHDSASWEIYSAFYFDSTKKCYAFTNERCDSLGMPKLNEFLTRSKQNWHKLNENKYLSDFEFSELLEIQIDKDCVSYRRTKLNLTRKQYRVLKRSTQDY
jgi:hypothetical protein